MARPAAERRGLRWLRVILIGFVVICGLGAAAIIIPPMVFAPAVDVALIKADPGPIKVKPADPGGAKIPHQETTVMGMIGGLAQTDENVEILRPPPVVPEMPPTTLPDAQTADEPVAPEGAATTGAAITEKSDLTDEPAQQAGGQPVDESGAQTAAVQTVESETSADQNADQKAAGSDNEDGQDAAVAMPTAKPKPPKRIAVEGDDPLYLVQLAAFRDAAKAREQAGLLNGKHKERLDGAELGTMKHDNGDDGVFWRVVSEPLPRVEADRICSALKRAGQDCILRKFDRAAG